ncbi:hypothetical protein KEC55_28975 [Burkholderia cepacia]|uniref:hypothetical protein n=1 Tax=Burkholderia cepacia TaxID=292 RepID=UPI00249E9F1D|nr:hypothetical protein [Burkholderia cepacia]WGY71035.1 hypothetical protein KEC55_28975 [Burkholderia cepacia]
MISAKAHSPLSRIIHSAPFAVGRFFVNEGKTRETTPQRLAGRTISVLFPGIFFRVDQCEYVIFSDMSALLFHSPEIVSMITNRN